MKGMMVTLLVFLMTGTVIGQQTQSDSGSDFSARRTTGVTSQDSNGILGSDRNGGTRSNALNALDTSRTSINGATTSNAGQPFRLPLDSASIEQMKKQGFIFSQIPDRAVSSVNGVLLTSPNRTKTSLTRGTLEPTIDQNGILHFEIDDFTIDKLSKADLEFRIPEQFQGRYDYLVFDYRKAGVPQGTASKAIPRETLRRWSAGLAAPPARDDNVVRAGNTDSLGVGGNINSGGLVGSGGLTGQGSGRATNPGGGTDFRNPLDRNHGGRNNGLADVARPQWRLPDANQPTRGYEPNHRSVADEADQLARQRWEANRRAIEDQEAERQRQARLQQGSTQYAQELALQAQRDREETARLNRELQERLRGGVTTPPPNRYADRNSSRLLDPIQPTQYPPLRYDNRGVLIPTYSGTDPAYDRIARNPYTMNERTSAEIALDRIAQQKAEAWRKQQEDSRALDEQIAYASRQNQDKLRTLNQLAQSNNQLTSQTQEQLRNVNHVSRTDQNPNFSRRDMSMEIPTTINDISKSASEGVRRFGDRAGEVLNRTNSKTEGALWLMLLLSVGLNVYLWWLARGFYVRYGELADELRETFTATTTL